MAAVTKNLGFGVTVATTYEQPYHLARRLSTVDHLTKGRLGWNGGPHEIVKIRNLASNWQ
jgi:alkanesulfonate monooxygenase SsuD/methylene tetrahydromethanopterin reductase-like flavin-dependent oxidoreductase (luciferase family)